MSLPIGTDSAYYTIATAAQRRRCRADRVTLCFDLRDPRSPKGPFTRAILYLAIVILVYVINS